LRGIFPIIRFGCQPYYSNRQATRQLLKYSLANDTTQLITIKGIDIMLKSLTKKLAPAAKVAGRVGFLLAPQLVLMAFGVYDHAAHAAGGLVGAAVDPAFGQANEVGMLADYGYDTARDISRVVTALSTVPSSMAGMKIAFGQRDGGESAMNVAKGLGVGFGAPTAVHLLGTFAINNFGGLGGGL
jgi:hypothetical protein